MLDLSIISITMQAIRGTPVELQRPNKLPEHAAGQTNINALQRTHAGCIAHLASVAAAD